MLRRIVVTLTALFLIGSGSADTNPHTVKITVSRFVPLASAHVFIGVAVLGHHVSRIESGWLVKYQGGGFMHIDWNKTGKWAGLTRTQEGPRDVSEAQMQQVIRVIESLGYPAAAIRAWRVPAPVGFDGFNEGDTVLTIGEILVDLGTVDQARAALDRWWDVASKDDSPFDAIPHTNVAYSGTLFFAPDCSALARDSYDSIIAQAAPIAALTAASAGTTAKLEHYDATTAGNVLCPRTRKPNFLRTSYGPPWEIQDFELAAPQVAWATYALAGRADQRPATTVPDDLSASTAQFQFDLAEPYAATIGTGSVTVQPQAVVLHFKYDLGAKKRKDYDQDLRSAQAQIAQVQSAVGDSANVLVKRSAADATRDVFNVFVLVRARDLAMVRRIAQAGQRGDSTDRPSYTAFVSGCDTAMHTALRNALRESRRKAELLARTIHAKLGALASARVDGGIPTGAVCTFDPAASLETLAAGIGYHDSTELHDDVQIALSPRVDAAWALDGVAHAGVPLIRTEYESEVRGTSSMDTIERRALIESAREAIVDNPHVVSIYETEPLTGNIDDKNEVTERIVVLRRP